MNSNNQTLISLLPSATEIVYALGLEDRLAAVTHECDFPEGALRKPKITRSKISSSMASATIHDLVHEQLSDSGTLYELDVKLLEKLSPDFILTQELCRVCAVSYDNVFRAASTLRKPPALLNLEPHSLSDIFSNIGEVAKVADVEERGTRLIEALQQRVDRVRRAVQGAPRKRILCLEWIDPPFCAGHWIPELVEIAGGADALGRKHQPSRQVVQDEIIEYNPEVIVVMCCGFSVARSLEEIPLLDKYGLDRLDAVREGEVYIVDGSSYFSRPGPRIIDSLEILATIMHPERFPIDFSGDVLRRITELETVSTTL
jgi:iron complex transport system substrate-binding protein